MTLGNRISEAINGARDADKKPKTKAQIARECGVTSSAVAQWLSGNTKSLKGETAIALEQSTGYRAFWILHGKGPKTLDEPTVIWPFPKVDIERFERLDEADKGYVQRTLLQAIIECEDEESAAPAPAPPPPSDESVKHLQLKFPTPPSKGGRGKHQA